MSDDLEARPAKRAHELRWAILSEVQRRQRIGVTELSQQLAVSEVSIRRHLEQLEQSGLLRRVHGGAEAIDAPGMLSIFDARLLQNTETKQALGRKAASLIRPGQAVFLDSGTTVLEIARCLPRLLGDSGSLTVLTRSLSIAGELRGQRRLRLILVGGVYAHDFDDFVGPQVKQTLQKVHADTLFLGIDGVSAERGLTTDNVLEADLFQDLARCAERVVLVTDSSKIGVTKVQTVLDLSDIHTFITDSDAPPDFLAMLQERGCEVLVVSKTDEAEPSASIVTGGSSHV